MSGSRKRLRRERDRELTRDEVWVPPLHEAPEQWERDNALFQYRLIRRSGLVGKICVAFMLIALALALIWDAFQTLAGL